MVHKSGKAQDNDNSFVQLKISKTYREMGKGKDWVHTEDEMKTFRNVKEAMDFLKETYGKASKQPMFIDSSSGAQKVGYIYKFRNYEFDDGRKVNFFENHWVEFRKVVPMKL